ncbi:MAG: ribonuclease E/G, partial [Nitratireductor sp.]|nr:ribonuclease E/G [Nitratireductor sp.]
MANNKMLIDASHPEETRVAVVRGNRVEEFDFESQAKKQLRGNIYLAKVTRVEPSLQAAFVDYGGNRHGFLAFSEIHPDYYQIPMADRQALLEEEAREANEEAEEEEGERNGRRRRPRRGDKNRNRSQHASEDDSPADDDADEGGNDYSDGSDDPVEEESIDTEDDSADAAQDDAEADEPESDDGDDEENGRSGTMAAMIESDSISEPAPEAEDGDGNGEDEPAAEEKPKRKRKAPAKPRKTKKQLAEEAAAAEAAAADEAAAESGDGGTGGDMDTEDAGSGAAGEEIAASSDDAVEADEETSKPRRNSRPGRNRRSGRSGGAEGSATSGGAGDRQGLDESDEDAIAAKADHGADNGADTASGTEEDEQVESVGQEDALEEVPYRRKLRRQYKIQEVIKRRQIMLVQVVKEERGNKGAALTTYLSLAGRYSVLMPNTARGGGISRKITNSADRKRLKEIAGELEVPQGMGVILRTAGASRTKPEVKRDFEYLMRLWENVRNLTLSSSAPCLVYEEGSLIKRSIR